ncbi:MAG: DNA translocase FtsK 4TM domain-containing protein [Terrimicrobiaceae bacterium]|nr:DNA translocase FtsK 4TM domain-containing protein [Terrimicrobiaceae bacterium]
MAKAVNTTVSEALGVLLLGAGILLLLALVSFDPNDVPAWVFFNKIVPANPHPSNFIGIVGVLGAGLLYFLIGAAAYLLAVVLLGFGAGKMFFPKVRFADRIVWIVLLLLSGASLLHLQPWFLRGWKDVFHVQGPGGWFGLWIGGKAFAPFGQVGSAIVLTVLYLVCLILVTGFHPIRFVKQCVQHVRAAFAAARARRRAKLDENALFAENQREIEKGARKLEKKIRRRPGIEPEVIPPSEPEPILPEPKIIDASVPAPPRKPTLEELKASKKKVNAPALIPGLQGLHLENYTLPSLDLLDPADTSGLARTDPAELKATQDVIIETLAQFSIQASPGDITKGPTITRYELYPAKGVRVDRISSLERDIARATRAERINILAPIPGKDTVGIEIANANKVKVTLRELFETDAWVNSKARLPLALGKDVYGNTIIADLAQMPHGLVAGTTGSGKSVCINAIIASLLFRFTPEELRFIMIDPKVVEMQLYNTLPHLVTPVVTEPKKVLLALRWVVDEMELRYRIIAKCGVRNIASFNARPKPKSQAELDAEEGGTPAEPTPIDEPFESPTDTASKLHPAAPDFDIEEAVNEPAPKITVPRDDDELIIPDHMPYIVVIIDELADLMQTAPADVEAAVARIAQKARAAGIHLIVATQTPRADVVTGIIKANIPSRIAFQVASKIDSRVILDENGAEKLLGQGDMLYLPPGTSKLIRSQGVLVTDDEIRRVVEFVSANAEPQFEPTIHEKLTRVTQPEDEISDEDEELVDKCLEIIKQEGKASTSMLQRRLRLGYTRAARVVDILEQRGILGPKDGAKDREILIDLKSLS